MYGYAEDKKQSVRFFGLNQKVNMTKFEWTNKAGSGGTEGECLDSSFLIKGDEHPLNERIFPFRAINWSTRESITDEEDADYKKQLNNYNANIMHIMEAFIVKEELIEKLKTFKPEKGKEFSHFVKYLMALLPKDFTTKELDLFLQYQNKITGNNKVTFLEVPKNRTHGNYVCAHVVPVDSWKVEKDDNGMRYVDKDGNIHPFVKNSYFLSSNNSKQQKEEDPNDLLFPSTETSDSTTVDPW
jgi:hypothetical protein